MAGNREEVSGKKSPFASVSPQGGGKEPAVPAGHLDPSLKQALRSIPQKMRFTIGEVARLLQVKTHTLRYWEREFKAFHPHKARTGRRVYFKKDVQTALLIRKLLYQDRFSIQGAKKALTGLKKESKVSRRDLETHEQTVKECAAILKQISHLKHYVQSKSLSDL